MGYKAAISRAFYSKSGTQAYVVDTFPTIRIRYKGTAAAPTVTVTNAAGTHLITLTAGGVADAIDYLGVGVTDTLGLLVDYINDTVHANTLKNWEAIIVGGLRADSCLGFMAKGATAATTEEGVTVCWASATSLKSAVAISFIENAKHAGRLALEPFKSQMAKLSRIIVTATGAGSVLYISVWKRNLAAKTETKIYTRLLTTATEKDDNFGEGYIKTAMGEDLVVEASSNVALTACDMSVIGEVM